MMRINIRKLTCSLIAALWIPLWAAAQMPTKDEGWSQLLPPGEGRAQVLESCTGCHNLKATVHERKDRSAWTKTVNDMVTRGAPLFPEEIEAITAYLAKAFGPGVPKPVNVNTATREDLEKLPNMKSETVERVLEARRKAGPFKNAEELRAALGMPAGDADAYIYFLKYKD